MKLRRSRKIYGKDYYRFKLFLDDFKAQERITRLKSVLLENDCGVPYSGFASLREYNGWLKKYNTQYQRALSSGIHNFPLISNELKKILTDYKLQEPGFLGQLRLYFYFGLNELYNPSFKFIFDDKKKQLWIQIFGYTRPTDFEHDWWKIEPYQKKLPDYKQRFKPRTSFHKQLQVNRVYEELKLLKRKERHKRYGRVDLYEAVSIELKKQKVFISPQGVKQDRKTLLPLINSLKREL